MLSAFVVENQKDWDRVLPYVLMAYRFSEHKTTGMTLNQLILGRQVELPLDVIVGLPLEGDGTPPELVEYNQSLRDRLEKAYDVARENTGKRIIRQK